MQHSNAYLLNMSFSFFIQLPSIIFKKYIPLDNSPILIFSFEVQMPPF